MKKLFYFLSLTMMLVSCQQTKESVQPNFSAYDSYSSNEVKEGRLVGVQGMVFQDGKLIYEKSYGLRDRESGDSMRGNELYFIQSMTKPIVSAALMTLYDEGKFQLDDPVQNIYQSFQVCKLSRIQHKEAPLAHIPLSLL